MPETVADDELTIHRLTMHVARLEEENATLRLRLLAADEKALRVEAAERQVAILRRCAMELIASTNNSWTWQGAQVHDRAQLALAAADDAALPFP